MKFLDGISKLLSRQEATQTEGAVGNEYSNGLIYGRQQRPTFKTKGLSRYKTFEKIRREVAVVSMSVNWFLDLVGGAQWALKASEADTDETVKDLFQQILFEDPSTSWEDMNRIAAMAKFFGFSLQEWTAYQREDGVISLLDIAVRPQSTIESWRVEDGVLIGANQSVRGRRVEIPIEKLIYLSDRSIDPGPEGSGLFDVICYDALRLMHLIEVLDFGYERDLRGIPISRVPAALINERTANATDEEKAKFKQEFIDPVFNAAKDFRRTDNETALLLDSAVYTYTDKDGVEKPSTTPLYDFQIITGDGQGLSEIQATLINIEQNIARTLGTEARLLGSTSAGSFALSRDKTSQFALSVESQLKDHQREFQKKLIPVFGRLNNIRPELLPTLEVEGVENQDPSLALQLFREITIAYGGPPSLELTNNLLAQHGLPLIEEDDLEQMRRDASLLDNPPEDEE